MTRLESALTLVSRALLAVAAVALALMMLHVSADIAAKLLLRRPITGTLESVSLFYMVAIVFLPLAMVQRGRQQVFVELFTQNAGPRLRAFLDMVALLLALVFCVLLTWKGFEVAVQKTMVRELSNNIEFQLEVWPGRWLPVLGYGATALWCLLQLAGDLRVLATGATR